MGFLEILGLLAIIGVGGVCFWWPIIYFSTKDLRKILNESTEWWLNK